MIIRVLVSGDNKGLESFHKQVSHSLNKINSGNNQVVYTCLDGQLDEIKLIATKSNLELYIHNDSDKTWKQVILKRHAEEKTR